MQNGKFWWENLTEFKDPLPHYLEEEIQKIVPENLKEKWDDYCQGKTVLVNSEGKRGMYTWDVSRFISLHCL